MQVKLIDGSALKISFTDKLMTAYGGFSLLSRLFERLSLESEVETMLPFKETSPNGTGVYAKILKMGLTVAAGGYRYTHSAFLGDSTEIYEQAFGVEKIPKSITAVTRFFNRFDSQKMVEHFADRLWNFLFKKVIPLKTLGEEDLSFDSTVVTRYGEQEGAKKGYNPKKRGRKSHHPIFAFLNRSRYVVNLWNRSGDTSSGNGIVDFCKQTLNRLSGEVTIKMVLADSGYYQSEFFDYLEEIRLNYIVATPMIQILQNEIYNLETWKDLGDGVSVGEFKFQHRRKSWTKERRYIVIRKDLSKLGPNTIGKTLSLFPEEDAKVFGYKYGLYVTSSERPGEDLWRQYRLRANDENIIKENKEDFALEGFALKGFFPTEAAMLVRIMYYNIINLFRREMLPEPESHQRLDTLRKKYFITPALLGRDGKSPVLRLGIKKQNLRHKFLYILNRINIYFANCNAFGGSQSPPAPAN
jgi:hypothetical protein